ncbi:labd-13Z-ene-9,15,16-triol synthase, chloroplastic-like [Tasmannia lanceolata]|uniref:labd-13Z-ene-9,15,16-triol synthase, chloroplastic-like n=1 Tax=Tasmannia lanceolata TaxID=3420 RepID=UPI004064317C
MASSYVAAKLQPVVSSCQKSETILTVLIALLAISWYTWRTKASRKRKLSLPPGPRGFPLLGYLPYLSSEIHHQLTQLAQIHGPIMKLWLGTKLCVVLTSPSMAKEVLRDQDTIFANRDTPESALTLYEGMGVTWSPYGSHWRKLRKLFVRELMSNTSLDAYYSFRRREVHRMVDDVHARLGTQIDVGEMAFITTLNIITSILWGETLVGEERKKVGVEFRKAIDEMILLFGKPNVSEFFPSLALFDLQGVVREMKKLFVWLERIFDSVIDQHMKMDTAEGKGDKKKGSRDLLSIFLELTKQGELTVTNVKATFLDMVIGATDTTSTTVEWAMAEIIGHPEVMKRVQEELLEVVGENNIVEESHLPKLGYLEAVVKEVQRLHPVAPFLVPARPSESTSVGGYLIPKGTKVMVNVYAIHRDPSVWENPLEFNPERFLGDTKLDYRGTNFRYLPFGSGRRMCAGVPMAERMLLLLIGSLLQSFEWRLPEGVKLDLSDRVSLGLKKAVPLVAIPTLRYSKP